MTIKPTKKRTLSTRTKKTIILFMLTYIVMNVVAFALIKTNYDIQQQNVQRIIDTNELYSNIKQTCSHDPCFLYEIKSIQKIHPNTVTFYVYDHNEIKDITHIKPYIIPSQDKPLIELTIPRDALPHDVYALVGQYVFVYENNEHGLQLDMVQP